MLLAVNISLCFDTFRTFGEHWGRGVIFCKSLDGGVPLDTNSHPIPDHNELYFATLF